MNEKSIKQTSIESLHTEHANLSREIAGLRRLLAEEFEWAALEAALKSLAGRLEEHFEFEESGGYFKEVLEIDPNRSREVDQLQDEHERMRDELRKAQHMIAEGTERETIRRLLIDLLKLQGDHEARETQLLIVTYSTDTGGGD